MSLIRPVIHGRIRSSLLSVDWSAINEPRNKGEPETVLECCYYWGKYVMLLLSGCIGSLVYQGH